MMKTAKINRVLGFLALCCGMAFGFGTHSKAQTAIPNGDFESWSPGGPFGNYEEPDGGWFVTLNILRTLGGPVTVEKSSDAHGGSFSAQLTTADWGTTTVPGLAVTGEFDQNDPTQINEGKPYTEKPSRFTGWYKYQPVNGDSAAIGALLTRWNTTTGKRDTVGETGLIVTDSVDSWTQFDLPMLYHLPSETPDSIVIALVSSAEGANFMGQPGSRLWVDDLEMVVPTVGLPPVNAAEMRFINPTDSEIFLSVDNWKGLADIELRNMRGQLLREAVLRDGTCRIPTQDLPAGAYLITLKARNRTLLRRKVLIQHQ